MNLIPTEVAPALAELRRRGDCDLRPCKFVSNGFRPIPPQKVGVAHLSLNSRFLLGDPVGCGKTPQALVAYAFLKERHPSLRLLVVTDKSAIFQWENAVAKFLTSVTVEVIGFDDKRKPVSRAVRWKHWERDADILIVNWHGMALDIDVALPHIKDAVVVLDEIQRVREWKGKLLHPAARRLSLGARYVWGLSATPVYNRVEDIYGIMEVLYPGFFGAHSKFAATYLREILIKPKPRPGQPRARWFKKLIGYQNLTHLQNRLDPVYLKRVPEAFDSHLPEVVVQAKLLTMPDKQAVVYREAMSRFFRNEHLNALTSLVYAQIVSDAPEVLGFRDLGSSKLDELQRFFREDLDETQKVIIYSRYERVVTYIVAGLKAIGITSLRITGKESASEREAAKHAFNTDPSARVICINAAGGQAIDLQAAGIIVFFDLPWSIGEWQQVIGRSRRIGSFHPKLLSILLLNENTVDQATFALLTEKEIIAKKTMPKAIVSEKREEENYVHSFSSSLIKYVQDLGSRSCGVPPTLPPAEQSSEVLPADLRAEGVLLAEATETGDTIPHPLLSLRDGSRGAGQTLGRTST